jgi:hypothetical protein
MKTLLCVVVPDPSALFGPDDQTAIDSLQDMFGQDILNYRGIGTGTYGDDLAQKYAMILPKEPAKFLYVVPDQFVGHFGVTLTNLDNAFLGSDRVLCVMPANHFSITITQGLVRANFGTDISDGTLKMMEAVTHGAFLFTAGRKGMPVIVTFPTKIANVV